LGVARHARDHEPGVEHSVPRGIPSRRIELRRDEADVGDAELRPKREVVVERLLHRRDAVERDSRVERHQWLALAASSGAKRSSMLPNFATITHSWWLIRQPS